MDPKFLKSAISLILKASLAFIAILQARAQDYPVKLNISLVATIQGKVTNEKSVVSTVRWNSKDVLSLISARLGITLPKGCALAFEDLGHHVSDAVVLDRQGAVFTNASALFSDRSSTNFVLSGRSGKAVADYRGIAALSFVFDDGNGNSFLISGLGKRRYFETTRNELFTINFVGAGEGKVHGTVSVFSGSIVGSGIGRSLGFTSDYLPALWWLSGGTFH